MLALVEVKLAMWSGLRVRAADVADTCFDYFARGVQGC